MNGSTNQSDELLGIGAGRSGHHPCFDGMGRAAGVTSGSVSRAFAQVLDVYERGDEVEP